MAAAVADQMKAALGGGRGLSGVRTSVASVVQVRTSARLPFLDFSRRGEGSSGLDSSCARARAQALPESKKQRAHKRAHERYCSISCQLREYRFFPRCVVRTRWSRVALVLGSFAGPHDIGRGRVLGSFACPHDMGRVV
jgi:hypothetical protein